MLLSRFKSFDKAKLLNFDLFHICLNKYGLAEMEEMKDKSNNHLFGCQYILIIIDDKILKCSYETIPLGLCLYLPEQPPMFHGNKLGRQTF